MIEFLPNFSLEEKDTVYLCITIVLYNSNNAYIPYNAY
jgi:hypothetical protein